ncbi:MAG TPA: L-serine ammonia-lyase, iron-sulfur-dependent, subunit alpha [Selenomonadales bacterium]|nr:L-serine ammonia-lyase, iron-sulfur-dependent, subunit alpha [Selenomonadales bacterium]
MLSRTDVVNLIQAGVMPALGCTEPGAVALAAAYARQALGQDPNIVAVEVDGNVYKNGLAVGIPGTGEVGLPIAAALGALIGDPGLQLQVLSACTPDLLEAARAMIKSGGIAIALNDSQGLRVRVTLRTAEGRQAVAVLEGGHTNLTQLEVDGEVLVRKLNQTKQAGWKIPNPCSIQLADMIRVIEEMPEEELGFLAECVRMNRHAAECGLRDRLGMAVGAHLQDLVREGLSDDLVNHAKILTAAGADARMSGLNIPVMSVAGSGNHGLTAILPVVAVAERLGLDDAKLHKGLAISVVTTQYIKGYTGGLSALCGCAVAAATGACAAIVWLMGGTSEQIGGAIKNMVANLTGMICDGGKVGCALKLATAAGTAVETALLTMRGVVVPCSNGIIFASAEDTIRNLGMVSNPGMLQTDKVILDIMLEKGRIQ